MKLKKRLSMMVAVATVVSSVSVVCASDIENKEIVEQLGYVRSATTTSGAITVARNPYLNLYKEVEDGKVYIYVDTYAYDNASIKRVEVRDMDNGGETSLSRYSGDTYRYRVTKDAEFKVTVTDSNGSQSVKYITVQFEAPEVDLYETRIDDKMYLMIDVATESEVDYIKVNGSKISLKEYSTDVYKYEITESKTYKVEVTDKNGQSTTESRYVSVAGDINITLSKRYEKEKWYIIIKADAENKIAKVEVNGSSISFNASGDEVERQVSYSGDYKVKVTDKMGNNKTETIYINVNENSDVKPTLTVDQLFENGKGYLVIKASDDGSIKSVTVNNKKISLNGKGEAKYEVPEDSNYLVVAEDNHGNKTQVTRYMVASTNSSKFKSSKFTLGSKVWYKNDVAQTMDTAPLVINGRVYLSMRYLAYGLDIQESALSWDNKAKVLTITDGNTIVKAALGSRILNVNNKIIEMDGKIRVINGRVMLPVSQVAKAFSYKGLVISWDNNSKTLYTDK